MGYTMYSSFGSLQAPVTQLFLVLVQHGAIRNGLLSRIVTVCLKDPNKLNFSLRPSEIFKETLTIVNVMQASCIIHIINYHSFKQKQ